MTSEHQAALAYAIIIFIGSFIIGAFMLAVLNGPQDAMINASQSQTNNTTAVYNGRRWVDQAWNWTPLFIMFLGTVQLIGRAVIERRFT